MKLVWNPPEINPLVAVFYNEDDASVDAHEGFTRNDGTDAPARPFITYGAEAVDIPKEVVSNFGGDIQNGGLKQAFEATAQTIHDEIMYLITEDVWDWDRTTHRRSGEVVTTPRDIVDLGGVRDGQKFEVFEMTP